MHYVIKYIAIITQAVLLLHQTAFRRIQKYFSPKMKTLFDKIVLMQLETFERQITPTTIRYWMNPTRF